MIKTAIPVTVAAILFFLIACTSFESHVFRTEQTATQLAFGAYVGYTNALPSLHLSPAQSNEVKVARLKFAATVRTLDALRSSYATNADIKPQIEAILPTLTQQSSNLVWLINFYAAHP